MALADVGGGQQLSDGNTNEIKLFTQPAPTAITADATLTAAILATRLITFNKGSDAAITATLSTGALMDAAFPNVNVDDAFDFATVNLNDSGSSSTVTMAAGTGFTIVGLVTVGRLASVKWRARRTATSTWVCYRLG
jgi:hypothetical protein